MIELLIGPCSREDAEEAAMVVEGALADRRSMGAAVAVRFDYDEAAESAVEARAVEAEKALRELDAAIEGGLVMTTAPTQRLFVKFRADPAGWARIVEARRAARIILEAPDA